MQLHPRAREAWQALLDVSIGRSASGPFAEPLIRIRNKVSFHYDCEEIYSGYEAHFFEGKEVKEQAFVSRGKSMNESRFYFADAAAQGYLKRRLEKGGFEEFFNEVRSAIENVNLAVFQLVDRFIQRRGFGYYKLKR